MKTALILQQRDVKRIARAAAMLTSLIDAPSPRAPRAAKAKRTAKRRTPRVKRSLANVPEDAE